MNRIQRKVYARLGAFCLFFIIIAGVVAYSLHAAGIDFSAVGRLPAPILVCGGIIVLAFLYRIFAGVFAAVSPRRYTVIAQGAVESKLSSKDLGRRGSTRHYLVVDGVKHLVGFSEYKAAAVGGKVTLVRAPLLPEAFIADTEE